MTQSDAGNLEFSVPRLELSDDAELADADVPDDVAAAVRRAIAAIESASVAAPAVAAPELATYVPEIADVEIDDVDDHGVPVVGGAVGVLGGFAPPTMATRAEVLYGLIDDGADGADDAVPMPGEALPTGGVASVVFVDDPVEELSSGGNDRSSALRRLIGSLRRKDH